MAKEELYHIALDDYEHGIVIRSLNDEKTDLMNEGKINRCCGRPDYQGKKVFPSHTFLLKAHITRHFGFSIDA